MKIIRCNICKADLATNEDYLTVSVKTGEPEKMKAPPVTTNAHICGECAAQFCKYLSIPTLIPGARKPHAEEE